MYFCVMKTKPFIHCMKKIFYLSIVCLMMVACENKKEKSDNADDPEKKVLVLYYSQTGATASVANQIRSYLNTDIEEIVCEEPYDGDFGATIERGKNELEKGEKPAIKPIVSDVQKYDIIFLGYPIWFGTYALPVSTLIDTVNFEGKTIVPFCTFGSGGLESSTDDLKSHLPKSDFKEGFGIRNARLKYMQDELDDFLKRNGYMEGEIEELPEFTAQEELTDEDKNVFHEACDDYPFPMGTPVSVAKRSTSKGTEFRFITSSVDGSQSTVLVELRSEDGAKAEFTKVIR